MPLIDLVVDFTNLESLSKAQQAVVANYLMLRNDVGAFAANFPYYFNQAPDTYAIRFKQAVELVASVRYPGRYHCFIPDEPLGRGAFATVRKCTRKVTLLPAPSKHGHFQFAAPKVQSRAIKYANLDSYPGLYEEASNAAAVEARHLGMVAPVRLHHRIPAGKSHSDIFVPRIIMNCYSGENLFTLSKCENLDPTFYSLQTKLELAISMLAKLMFLQQQGLIHLDLKHLNMIADLSNREINFVDFAWAVEIDKFEKDEGDIRGSPSYIAPERFDATCKSPKAIDTFSVGVVIAELFVTDEKLWKSVVSRFLTEVCYVLYENWESNDNPFKGQFKKTPRHELFLTYLRDSLLTFLGKDRTDVFIWNNVSSNFATQLAKVVGQKILNQVIGKLEGYTIPYENELDDDQRQELTTVIMSLVATEPSARATASEALNHFILFYQKKYADETETLRLRIQKQLLLAAVDVAIQILKNEVYYKPFDELSPNEKPKIDCLRQILERLKQFKKQAANRSSEQMSASSSSESRVSTESIEALRQQVIACFISNEKVISTLSSNRSFQGKAINGASQLFGYFFSNESNQLAATQAGRYLPKRFRVAEKALQIIEDTNRMADNIFASVSAPSPQSSPR